MIASKEVRLDLVAEQPGVFGGLGGGGTLCIACSSLSLQLKSQPKKYTRRGFSQTQILKYSNTQITQITQILPPHILQNNGQERSERSPTVFLTYSTISI